MQNITAVYGTLETESATDVAKWELITGMKQTLLNEVVGEVLGRITLYL